MTAYVATVDYQRVRTDPSEYAANARLIAAAPELFDLVKGNYILDSLRERKQEAMAALTIDALESLLDQGDFVYLAPDGLRNSGCERQYEGPV
jgi:hypothetical protein